jgi:hypothetical protein
MPNANGWRGSCLNSHKNKLGTLLGPLASPTRLRLKKRTKRASPSGQKEGTAASRGSLLSPHAGRDLPFLITKRLKVDRGCRHAGMAEPSLHQIERHA